MKRRTFLTTAGAALLVPHTTVAGIDLLPRPSTPPAARYAQLASQYTWHIECRCRALGGSYLYVYQRAKPFIGYPALGPDVDEISGGRIHGRVNGIQMPPRWAPTPNMKARDPSLRAYAPGEHGNPMGQVAKISISGFGYRRIHSYTDPRGGATAGCVAIDDAHMRDWVARLGGDAGFRSNLQGASVVFYVDRY